MITDPRFWAEIVAQFRALPWDLDVYYDGGKWTLRGGGADDSERNPVQIRFERLASDAAAAAGVEGGMNGWLDLLRKESGRFRTIHQDSKEGIETQSREDGLIRNLGAVSAEYCEERMLRHWPAASVEPTPAESMGPDRIGAVSEQQATAPTPPVESANTAPTERPDVPDNRLPIIGKVPKDLKSEPPGDTLRAPEAQVPKESRRAKKPVRRNERYERIDEALRDIAEANPKSHEEVFRQLDNRGVKIPANRKPFKSAGGWWKAFEQSPHSARAWLTQAWGKLNLAAFPRGPKK